MFIVRILESLSTTTYVDRTFLPYTVILISKLVYSHQNANALYLKYCAELNKLIQVHSRYKIYSGTNVQFIIYAYNKQNYGTLNKPKTKALPLIRARENSHKEIISIIFYSLTEIRNIYIQKTYSILKLKYVVLTIIYETVYMYIFTFFAYFGTALMDKSMNNFENILFSLQCLTESQYYVFTVFFHNCT